MTVGGVTEPSRSRVRWSLDHQGLQFVNELDDAVDFGGYIDGRGGQCIVLWVAELASYWVQWGCRSIKVKDEISYQFVSW